MKKVTAYQADDGQLYKTRLGAEMTDARHALGVWLDGKGICRGGDWTLEMVQTAMLDDAKTLAAIFEALSCNE